MAKASGSALAKAATPAAASTTNISCVAYATDDIASEEKTASPIVLPMA